MKNIEHKISTIDIAGKLAKYFLHSPLTPVLAVFILALGYLALVVTPREENPQISISGGTVIVAMPGATPKEIENVIINPLERKLKEIKGIEHIYGTAMKNVGVVNVMYYIGQDREKSNFKLYDKVMQNIDEMPKDALKPIIKPFDIDIDIPIVTVAFYPKNKKVTNIMMYKTVRNFQQKVNSIKNVAKTTLKGFHKEQFNIFINLYKLNGYHISLGQVVNALKSLSYDVPDIKDRTEKGKLVIFGVKNAIENINDVKNIIIAQYMGSPIYLKDIATVKDGINFQDKRSAYISFKNKENKWIKNVNQVTLTISKLKGTNAVFVANDIKKELNKYKKELNEKGIGYIITRNYGKRANAAVNELVMHLLISIAIIAIVLIFVLGWRESLIVTFTVPAIFSITIFIDYMTGQSINRITLFALILSLGLLVDAAIIVIENIHRHLHSHDSIDKNMDEILIEATDEIGAPTNIATFAIILTMIPMAFVGQMMGQFMKPIPENVPIALIASLVVAYIFTPYLSRLLLKKPKMHHHEHHFDKDKINGGKK